jgi:hypothetical protein
VIVEAFIASLNDAVMIATPVAPFTGLVDITVGATVSPEGLTGLSLDPHPTRATIRATNGHTTTLLVRGCIGMTSS